MPPPVKSQYAKRRLRPSSRWPRPLHSHSLWNRPHMPGEPTVFTHYFLLIFDTSSPTEPTASLITSHELHGQQPVPHPWQSFTIAPQSPKSVTQSSTQPPHSSSWADEFAAEQSGYSTPKTVAPNWAYSGRIRCPTRFHDLSLTLRLWRPHRYHSPPAPTNRVTEYPQLLHPDLNHPTLNHLHTIGQPLPTVTLTMIFSQADAPGLWRTISTLCARCRFSPHSCLLGLTMSLQFVTKHQSLWLAPVHEDS